jgi:hypothetical protein
MPYAIDVYTFSHTEYALDSDDAEGIEDGEYRLGNNFTRRREISQKEYDENMEEET